MSRQHPALYLAAVAVSAAIVSAQGPFPPPPAGAPPVRRSVQEPNEVAVVVAGCVRGARLELAQGHRSELPAILLHATGFALEGPRELLQQIRREHDGHYDEIAGVAVVPRSPAGATADVITRDAGTKGRIVIGKRQATNRAVDAQTPVRLKVESLTHVAENCVPAR